MSTAIPPIDDIGNLDHLQRILEAMKQNIEDSTGQRGEDDSSAMTQKELIDVGLLKRVGGKLARVPERSLDDIEQRFYEWLPKHSIIAARGIHTTTGGDNPAVIATGITVDTQTMYPFAEKKENIGQTIELVDFDASNNILVKFDTAPINGRDIRWIIFQ
jgi:hypothetical protein